MTSNTAAMKIGPVFLIAYRGKGFNAIVKTLLQLLNEGKKQTKTKTIHVFKVFFVISLAKSGCNKKGLLQKADMHLHRLTFGLI